METSLRPYFRKPYLLTKAEQNFFEKLREVIHDHLIFAKVRLADLIDAHEWREDRDKNFYRVCSKHIDFVICDALSRPIVAIELDDKSHQLPDRVARDRELDELFSAVRFPLRHVAVKRYYTAEQIRELLPTKLQR